MSGYPNIYATVVFDLHPKVKDFIDQLNQDGQIDMDQSGYPYLIRCTKQGANYFTQISRNNRLENFVLNPRKKAEPVCSWNPNDGFQRPQQKQTIVVQQPETANGNTKERERKKVSPATVESIVESIMEN